MEEALAGKRAVCYIRVSTEEQTEYSPDSQKKAISDYAEAHGIVLLPDGCYADIGISGRKAGNRPAFLEMLGRARERPRPFDLVLVWKFSRFSRSRSDSIVYKQQLRKLGVSVVSVTEPICADPTAVLMEAMLEAMDEYYSLNLGEEVRRGMREKFRRGGVVTGAPFGYRVEEGRFVLCPEEAEAVRQMRAWRGEGCSYREIAERLNDGAVRTRRGGRFHGREVSYILHNPIYWGYQRWDGQLAPGDFPRIFPEDLPSL